MSRFRDGLGLLATLLCGCMVACVADPNVRRPAPRPPGPSVPLPGTSPADDGTDTPAAEPETGDGRVPIPPMPSADPTAPTFPAPAPPLAPASAPAVRVVLSSVTKAGRAPIQIDGAFEIRTHAGAVIDRGRALKGEVAFDAGGARVGAATLPADGAVVVPATDGDLRIGGRRYPGVLRIAVGSGGKRTAQVELDLETYLEGVVVGELPANYPREAMRCQAIVARTYVLTQNADPTRGIVVDDTGLSDQEFAGIANGSAQRTAVHDVVQSTRGTVVASRGRPIRTWYHSTCGGETCDAQVVFRSPPAILAAARETGLRGGVACDACTSSSRYRWSNVRVPGDRIVKAAGLSGTLTGFVVAERTPGGRAVTVDVYAGRKQARLPAAEVRLASDPKLFYSTWLDSAVVQGGDLVISGRGWGHGVGLCQVGAKGYATRGWTAERIVPFYYPGAELVRLW